MDPNKPGVTANRPQKISAKGKALIGAAISAILLVWVLSRLNFSEIPSIVAGIHFGWYIAALAVKLTVIVVKGFRWRVVLNYTLGQKCKRVVAAVFIGYFGNAVFPAKLGELARLEVCRRHNPAPFSQVLATLLFERTLDLAILLCFIAIVLPFASLPGWARDGALPIAGITLVLVIGIIFAAQKRVNIPRWLLPGRYGSRLRLWLDGFLLAFSNGLKVVKSPRTTAYCSALTLVGWSLEVGSTYLMLTAFGLSLPWFVPLLLTALVTLGVAVPSAPSGIGTHQLLWMVLLGGYGVAEETAVSISVLIVVSMVCLLSILGSLFVWREGMSLNLARSLSPQKENQTEN